MKIFLPLALFCLSLPALADWSKLPSAQFPLGPFPVEGSVAFQKDFEELHRWEATRSSADCALSRRQERPSYHPFFAIPESPLTAEEAESAARITERAMGLAERIADYHKGKFQRVRPYDTDPTLRPCIDLPGGRRSYPSSHAAAAAMGACVLGAIWPEKSAQLREYGARLGALRVVVGVHHPSDVAAGQELAARVCATVLNDPEFRAEMREVSRGR